MSKITRRAGGALLTLGMAAVLSACGSPSEVQSQATASGSAPAASSSGSSAGQEALQAAYQGQMGTPPTATTTPPKDVDLWIVSCGQQVPGCSAPTASAEEAAKVVGWTTKVCDGQLNPAGWGTCVRQATSAGADVIIPIGIDCPSVQQPFQEAKDAGVTVIGGGGVDCDAAGGSKLWGSERLDLEGLDGQGIYTLQGKLAADWLIGKTNGQAKVLQVQFTDSIWGPWIDKGFADQIATCDACEITSTLKYSAQDIGSGALPQKFSTALLQAAKADSVFFPVGGVVNGGLAQAVVDSGRSDTLNVVTALGGGPNYALIQNKGGLDAAVGYPLEWGAWGSVDTAIRVLNKEEPLVQGDGYQVVDAAENLPAEGAEFTGGVDYKAAYRAAWGL